MSRRAEHYKDQILDVLAEEANVAQFVSFGPGIRPRQRFARVRSHARNQDFGTPDNAVRQLVSAAAGRSVNVRSFDPGQPQANEFVYGLTDPDEAISNVRRLAATDLYTIVNETIDIHDGGVSGVILGEVIEFAPEDTPRAVEKPGVTTLPVDIGRKILETVYGHSPTRPPPGTRVEFSLHPTRVGYRNEHIVTWEREVVGDSPEPPWLSWPNRFSRFIGDKAFGLLVAWLLGEHVPDTLVIPRRLQPFRFGDAVRTSEVWTRTCPPEPVPGRFSTTHGYTDPFTLLQEEDPTGKEIASVLVQSAIDAEYSGAAASGTDGAGLFEGVAGTGAAFMKGDQPPQPLPSHLDERLRVLHGELVSRLGPVKFEWVHDGSQLWVLQLHVGPSLSSGLLVYPGDATKEHRFHVRDGLEELRAFVDRIQGTGEGVVLVGSVGLTSHFGDVLRRAKVPSRIEVSSATP